MADVSERERRTLRLRTRFLTLLDSSALGCERLAILLAILVLGALGVASLFVTVLMAGYTEAVSYAELTLPSVVFVTAAVVGIYALLRRGISLERLNSNVVGLSVALVLFFGSMVWAILCNTFPSFDQLDLIHAAKELGSGRVGTWAPGWYMERFSFQTPYVILIRVMWRIFGDDMLYLSLELVNSVCAAATGFLLVKLSERLFSPRAALGTAMMTVIFLPLYFYATFAYGNVPSLPFAVGAMLALHHGLETRRWRYFAISSVCIVVSIMLKSTMHVVLIAMVLIVLLRAVKVRSIKVAVAAPMIGVVYLLATSLFNGAVSARYDVVLDNGLPKTAWIAMGLSDAAEYPDVSNNPGYYNGFVWNWKLEEYDVQVAASDSAESIRNSIGRFFHDPGYAVRFFSKKIALVWLEPTFTSLVNGNWSVPTNANQKAMSERPMTDVLRSIYYGKLNSVILAVCDAVQTILLLSPVVVLLGRRGKTGPLQLLPVLAVLGFFLIYLVWEAKSQYALPAYVLLLVYAGAALELTIRFLGRAALRLRNGWDARRRSAELDEQTAV